MGPCGGVLRALRIAALAAAALALAGCPLRTRPRRPPPPRPTAAQLAADALALARAARQSGVPAARLLVAAYLATYRRAGETPHPGPAPGWTQRCQWLESSHWSATRAAAALADLRMPSAARLRHFLATLLSDPPCGAPHPRPGSARPGARKGTAAARGAVPTWEALLAPTGRFVGTSAGPGAAPWRREGLALARAGRTLTGLRWVLEGAALPGTRRASGAQGRGVRCLPADALRRLRVYRLRGSLAAPAAGTAARPAAAAPVMLHQGPVLRAWQGRADEAPARAPARCAASLVSEGRIALACGGSQRVLSAEPLPPFGPASGVYTWQGVSPRADGGRERTRETWHLVETGGRVFGFYVRQTIAFARHGDRFACNGQTRYTRTHLFVVAGRRQGATGRDGALSLRELAVLGTPGPCDPKPPSLDRYAGKIGPGAIVLSWGSGSQTLRRTGAAPLPALGPLCQ